MPLERPEELLARAAEGVVPSHGKEEPWMYGWCLKEHRHSGSALLSGSDGPVTLSEESLDAYESAMSRIVSDQQIRLRWDPKEIWGIVASLVADASTTGDKLRHIEAGLSLLRKATESLVVLPIANATWVAKPARLGDLIVVGRANAGWVDCVNEAANGRSDLRSDFAQKRLKALETLSDLTTKIDPEPVVFATWTAGQRQLAVSEASRRLEDFCALSLLLHENLEEKGLWSMRGSTNRPGIRGLALDRSALERLLSLHPNGPTELSSQPICISDFASYEGLHWYSADPLPLYRLLDEDGRLQTMTRCLTSQEPVPARLRVAARWYANAHWASEGDDAALALGVALDSIVGSKGALPGYRMAQRFAFLDDAATRRHKLVSRYQEIFGVRSAIAHGGRSSALDEDGYTRAVAEDVTWAARRLVQFDAAFAPTTEAAFEEAFEGLIFGTVTWPS